GTTVTGFASANGTNWTQIGTTTVTMTATLAGLAVTSHDSTALNIATFDNVIVGLPPAVPSVIMPAAGAAGVSTAASMIWTAAGATSYDVNFGTTNPPSPLVSGLTAATYAPVATAS